MAKPRVLVVTHGMCQDGLGAAWVMWRALGATHALTLWYASYTGRFPSYGGYTHIYFTDFTPPPAELAKARAAAPVTIYDHHAGSRLDDAVVANDEGSYKFEYVCDTGGWHSGVSLVARVFPVPPEYDAALTLLRRFDVWNIDIEVMSFHAGLAARIAGDAFGVPIERMPELDAMLLDPAALVASGRVLLPWQYRVTALCPTAPIDLPDVDGPRRALAVFCVGSCDKSMVAEYMAQWTGHDIVAVLTPSWHVPNTYRCSTRSQKHDILALVKRLGIGNGHPHSTGGVMTHDQLMAWRVAEDDAARNARTAAVLVGADRAAAEIEESK